MKRLLLAMLCGFLVCECCYAQPMLPDFSSAAFDNSLIIDNPYWPLVPGTTYNYEGVSTDPDTGETETETIIVEVLNETRTVFGVETRIVRDRVFLEGLLIEDTFDWYAQDNAGNVLRIRDSSALFPEFGHKSYAPGIGAILELEFDEEGIRVGTVELMSVVPEPATLWLLAVGGCCLSAGRRRMNGIKRVRTRGFVSRPAR